MNAATDVSVYLGEDRNIGFGDSIRIDPFVNVPYDSLAEIIWTSGDTVLCELCPTIAVAPFTSTTYAITVVSTEGCSASDELTVQVARPEIFAPTAFSPNGDGSNDRFTLFAQEGYVASIKSLLIFDRWGDHLASLSNLQPNDVSAGWDGRSRDQELNTGVVVWVAVLEYFDGSEEVFRGDLTLVR
ncbi:MAG: gliding motility-associated C-terminal domain-containing protein [Saprospiraceae bacterium]